MFGSYSSLGAVSDMPGGIIDVPTTPTVSPTQNLAQSITRSAISAPIIMKPVALPQTSPMTVSPAVAMTLLGGGSQTPGPGSVPITVPGQGDPCMSQGLVFDPATGSCISPGGSPSWFSKNKTLVVAAGAAAAVGLLVFLVTRKK